MRENNRKSIASKRKLPQFITMNVIDGQASLVFYSSLIFYSLTIDNILNIIILLILAGISISALTGSGLFGKAQEAVKLSKLKEIEELARLSYMERQLDEISGGENATIAGVISDLKEKGYTIKEITGGTNSITGIALSEEDITVERNTEKAITYTFVYSDGTTVRYFVEVDGKDYEIVFNNGEIIVNTEETNLGDTNKEPVVTIESSNNNIIEVNKTEDGKIVLTAKDEIGDVEITIKEENSNVTKIFTATTRIPATSLKISQTEAEMKVGETLQLTAIVEPSNTTDSIIWNTSDESIATVTENGLVTAINPGEVEISLSVGNESATCVVKVVLESLKLDYKGVLNAYNSGIISTYCTNTISMQSNTLGFSWNCLNGATHDGAFIIDIDKINEMYRLF